MIFCVLIDVPGTLLLEQFEVVQFQVHFTFQSPFSIANSFEQLIMINNSTDYEAIIVEFFPNAAEFQWFLAWFSQVQMTYEQEDAVFPLVKILIELSESLPGV